MARPHVSFALAPYDYAAAVRLAEELGVSHTVAQILVRRGHVLPSDAQRFLDADTRYELDAFPGLRAAAAEILEHVDGGSQITVHGDYDADGVCSTAILVRALRTLGARVDWYLPSRFEDGYGLALATVQRLSVRGTGLLILSDCGVTAVDEVAAARAAGMDVVVSDHHSPRADGLLPDATLVHPRVAGYPCPDLCAAGVAYKLAAALLEVAGMDPALVDEDLDLVAIATVADVVSLRGENRRLVRDGLRRLASTRKPGLRALMEVASLDPSAVDASGVSFRLAPRINAAGRLRRADAALELIMTGDAGRAKAIAAELDGCNAERRDVETRILFEAEAQVARHGDGAPAYVLAGDGWHPGVVGIVASRIAERHHRPAVLIALDAEAGTGSGRSIPGFDLLAGLRAASGHLLRYGGHRAAAGLSIARECVDAFRTEFSSHAARTLTPDDLTRVERIDAVVSGDELTLELAEELQRLAPFGMGNPGVSLLVPSAVLDDPRPMGEGRHVGFHLTAGGARSRAVCFGAGSRLPAEAGAVVEAAVRLEVNSYNGITEPRVVLRHARSPDPSSVELVGEPVTFVEGLSLELDRALDPWPPPPTATLPSQRAERDRRGTGIAGLLADLVATGEPVLAIAAHAPQRVGALSSRVGGFSVASWAALEDQPDLAAGFPHVVAIDPPAHDHLRAWLARVPGEGWTHLVWGPAELRFAYRILEWDYDLRPSLTALYRELRSAGGAQASHCEALLCGNGSRPRSPALAGRLLRILAELGLVEIDRDGPAVSLAPAGRRTELERSAAFRAYRTRFEDGRKCLTTSDAELAA